MHVSIPTWPREIPRVFKPLANIKHDPALSASDLIDRLFLSEARRVQRMTDSVTCLGIKGTWQESFFSNTSDYTASASNATETSLLTGVNQQPWIPALYLDTRGRGVSFFGKGVLSTTAAPTIIFTCRLGSTAGVTQLGGTQVGVSPTITCGTGVTNTIWDFQLDLIVNTPGLGTGNTTLSGAGYVRSPAGFVSPFAYALEPTTPNTATWTVTLDDSLTQYFVLSNTWGTNSASNTCTLKQLYATAMN